MTLRITAVFLLSFAVMFSTAGSLQAQTKLDRPIVQPAPGSVTSGYEKWSCRYSSTVAGTGAILDGGGVAQGTLVTGDIKAKNSRGETVVYEDARYILEGTLKRICASEPQPVTAATEPPKTKQFYESQAQ